MGARGNFHTDGLDAVRNEHMSGGRRLQTPLMREADSRSGRATLLSRNIRQAFFHGALLQKAPDQEVDW
jgi:hypothetical protein